MWEWLATNAIALATALITGLTLFLVMRNDIKNLGDGHKQIRTDIQALAKSIKEHQAEDDRQFELIRRETGETVHAIREKIREVELYCRDNFMRKESAYKMQETLQADFRNFGEKMDERLIRMENKIDTKT